MDQEMFIGSFKVPFLKTGFRMVVFSIVIMIVVLFFRQGIMGTREYSLEGIVNWFKKKKGNLTSKKAGGVNNG